MTHEEITKLVKDAWSEGVAAGSNRIGTGRWGNGKKVKIRFKDSKAKKRLDITQKETK